MTDFVKDNILLILMGGVCIVTLGSCAAFDAFVADPVAMSEAQSVATALMPWPANLLVPGAFAVLAALAAPQKESP